MDGDYSVRKLPQEYFRDFAETIYGILLTIILFQERAELIKHIVMWRFKDSYRGMNKEEIIGRVRSDLEGLKESITEIKAMEVGENFNSLAAAFDVSLYSEFESKEDLGAYQKHPEHVKAAQFIRDVRTDTAVVDYEVAGA